MNAGSVILLIAIPLAVVGFVWFIVKSRRSGSGVNGAPYYGGHSHDGHHGGGGNSHDSHSVGDFSGGDGGGGGGGE